ncbi:hypothetical protein BH11GEM2_BH11GEM2_09180 [soil metagenome]
MKRTILPLLLCAASAHAQDVAVHTGAGRRSAEFVREAVSQPHVVVQGTGRLDVPRDSTITSTLIVIGRPTYLAGKVQGNVVVIGADLFLRPGADVAGHAVAIGGTVAPTTLGRVGGRIESYQDDVYDVSQGPTGTVLDLRQVAMEDPIPLVQTNGIYGIMIPTYERVDGLSLPLGALVTLPGGAVVLEPTVTYRSRLGAWDPSINALVNEGGAVHFAGRAGYFTRTNDAWNYSDLVNSATSFFGGLDSRNYFRSKTAEGRIFAAVARPGLTLEPFIGGRYESVSAITAAGNVFSVKGRKSDEKIARINPSVDAGTIGSGLVGAQLYDTLGLVTSRLRVEAEQSFTTVTGTGRFTQFTLDGRLGFPTFGTQSLRFRAHAVGTLGDSVARARYAYLGGSGTLPVVELLELGGTDLLFVESRYMIPLPGIVLPLVGSPVITLRHLIGSAGVGSLPRLEQEIGAGLGLSALRLDYTTDAGGNRGHKFGIGISLGP